MDHTTEKINTEVLKKYKKKSRFNEIWQRMKRNRIAMVGLSIFVVIALCTLLANFIVPYQTALEQNIADRLQTPSAAHWFGTDVYGRDIFARIIHGTRYSLIMGLALLWSEYP
jgi:peptide/nickel transport system permease protein